MGLCCASAAWTSTTAPQDEGWDISHFERAGKLLGAVLSVLAVGFGLFFYAYLGAYFRSLRGVEWLASPFFGGP